MLKLFRSQIVFFPLALIVILMAFLRLNVYAEGFFVNHWETNLAPLSVATKMLLGSLLTQNLWFNLIFSAVLMFIQASITVTILNYFKVEALKGFLVAWLYVLILHLFPAFVFLSPELIAATLILLALEKFIFIDESRNKLKQVFTAGLMLSLATAFWIPSIFFLPLAVSALIRANFFSVKIFLSLLLSFSIPFIYAYSFLYLSGLPFSHIRGIQLNQFYFDFYKPKEFLSLTVLILIVMLSLPLVFNFFSKTLKKPKEFFSLLWLYVFLVFVLFFFQNDNTVNILILMVFPVSIILSVYFNRIKRNFVAEALHLVLLLSIIVNFIYFLK